MEINVYDEFLSPDEIIFMTGYTQPARQMERLNKLGIPFIEPKGCSKYPIIRREYKSKIKNTVKETKPKERRRSAVLA